MRQVVLDTETTGLDPEKGHRVIEIGCIELIDRQLTDHTFHCYLNPERDIEKGAEAVHGLTHDFLEDKPYFQDIAEDLVAYIDQAELIIHNAPFDIGFLDAEFKRLASPLGPTKKYSTVIDTLTMARALHPGQKNNLDALCKRYNVNNKQRQLHGALLDAQLLAAVYLAMSGGQGSLFSDTQEQTPYQTTTRTQDKQRKTYPSLPVITATPEELQAHEDFISLIKKASDHACVWAQPETQQE